MFKIPVTHQIVSSEIKNIADQVLICIKAIGNGDSIVLGSAVKRIQLHALNVMAAISYEDETWRATERKRKKLVAGVEALSGMKFEDLSREEVSKYSAKLEQILVAVSQEWPHQSTHIPRRVFRIYVKEAELYKLPKPINPQSGRN